MVGVNPEPYTFRELVWMYEGCTRELWNHTAAVLATMCNANSDPRKTRAYRVSDFHPEYQRRQKVKAAPITVLRDVFIDGNQPDLTGAE